MPDSTGGFGLTASPGCPLLLEDYVSAIMAVSSDGAISILVLL